MAKRRKFKILFTALEFAKKAGPQRASQDKEGRGCSEYRIVEKGKIEIVYEIVIRGRRRVFFL